MTQQIFPPACTLLCQHSYGTGGPSRLWCGCDENEGTSATEDGMHAIAIHMCETRWRAMYMHMVKNEEGERKQQATGPQPATLKTLGGATDPYPLMPYINPFPCNTSIYGCYRKW